MEEVTNLVIDSADTPHPKPAPAARRPGAVTAAALLPAPAARRPAR